MDAHIRDGRAAPLLLLRLRTVALALRGCDARRGITLACSVFAGV